ncbi:MAG: hypothetical protein WBW14_05040 [Candidatus Acidiferrum sp.]|jgi:hypothetical protein
MKKLQHPLKGVVEALREAILRTDGEIGEESNGTRRRSTQGQ